MELNLVSQSLWVSNQIVNIIEEEFRRMIFIGESERKVTLTCEMLQHKDA
jgi:hypothetical protein